MFYDIHTHRQINEPNSVSILNIAPQDQIHADQYYSLGIHPWERYDLAEIDVLCHTMEQRMLSERVVAIGEAGFDRPKGSEINIQQDVFDRQVQLSEIGKMPLIIHCVKCWDELFAAQKRHQPKQAWILHGYRGKEEQTKQLLDHGFYFSIGARYNSQSLLLIPDSSLFCETDNLDVSIVEVYTNVAKDRNSHLDSLTAIIEQNVRKVFLSSKI